MSLERDSLSLEPTHQRNGNDFLVGIVLGISTVISINTIADYFKLESTIPLLDCDSGAITNQTTKASLRTGEPIGIGGQAEVKNLDNTIVVTGPKSIENSSMQLDVAPSQSQTIKIKGAEYKISNVSTTPDGTTNVIFEASCPLPRQS